MIGRILAEADCCLSLAAFCAKHNILELDPWLKYF